MRKVSSTTVVLHTVRQFFIMTSVKIRAYGEGAIISQNSRTDGGDPPTMTVVLVIIVFVIGLALFFSGGGNKDNEAEYEYSNEEIEKELEEFNK